MSATKNDLTEIMPIAYELYQRSVYDENATDLRSARENGLADYNSGLDITDCPYPANKSQRRRAVWMLSWIIQSQRHPQTFSL